MALAEKWEAEEEALRIVGEALRMQSVLNSSLGRLEDALGLANRALEVHRCGWIEGEAGAGSRLLLDLDPPHTHTHPAPPAGGLGHPPSPCTSRGWPCPLPRVVAS